MPSPRRAAAQRIENLQRAGVTHIARPRRKAAAKPPEKAEKVEKSLPAAKFPAAAAPAVQGPVAAADRPAALAKWAKRVAACTRCKELAATRTQTVFGTGNPNAQLVFIGEAPGADEDRQGEPFVGAAGQLLNKILEASGLKREEVYIMNILRCRPPGNRTPLPDEAGNCREYLDAQLAIIRPAFICCLGACAAQNLLGTTTTIGRLRGAIHDHDGMKVVCTYHPAYLMRSPDKKKETWADMQMLIKAMGRTIPSR
jgi:DNA polymerase